MTPVNMLREQTGMLVIRNYIETPAFNKWVCSENCQIQGLG
jgi:hypothetical protein